MCGRFTLTSDMDLLLYRFAAIWTNNHFDHFPRYNIAPTQQVLSVVNNNDQRELKPLKWGLIPSWSKELNIGVKMINARCETIAEKPSFKNLLKRKRCLIPADGFYEWIKLKSKKQPVYIRLKSEAVFSFAGLWDTWRSPTNETINSCTIITTNANDLIAPVHNRMPVIFTPEQEKLWLDPTITDNVTLTSLLKPFPEKELTMYNVNPIVNSPRNDSPECIARWSDS